MFDLVIFDCDGVLVDSESASDSIISRLLSEIGIELSPEEVRRRSQGMSDRDMWAMFARDFARPMPRWLKAKYQKQETASLRQNVVPIPGVEALLGHLSDRRQSICVASSGTKAKMRISLGVTRLSRFFSGNIFSASQVRNGKPAPDLFLFAAERMGFQPERCAVVEDSVNGVCGGVAAGMKVFAYSRVGPSAELTAAGGHIFSRMEELLVPLGI